MSEQQKAIPPDTWGLVELMGRLTLAGRISEVERFGGKLGRVDVPAKDGGFTTQFFGAGSVYRITFTSEQVARDAAARTAPPVSSWDYPPEVREALHAAKAALPAAVLPEGDEMPYGEQDSDSYDPMG